MKNLFAFVLVAALWAGCATPEDCGTTPRRVTFARPYDVVWEAVLAELAGSGHKVSSDRWLGEIRTDRLSMGSGKGGVATLREYACEPRTHFEQWSGADVSAAVRVMQAGDTQTTIEIQCEFHSFENHVRNAWYRWRSTGLFEERFLARVHDRLVNQPARTAAAK